ncbi:cation:dicarboxylate symporter family transporter [uncultured Massilia sp.]|uniref:cation:dicarboxylate symporter family transporter n=1 Tax=uncultured Massilia sp. TaxID=169973 RepID=UPI0025CEE642|nr:cation:dicarboxylase symporter family transporter [uncultured Massilia sp.]
MGALRRHRFLLLVLAVGAGLALGLGAPRAAVQMKPLSDVFVRLLGWLMMPLVFCMLALGTAGMARARSLGRLGLRALLYFGAMSLLSLLAGLAAGWLLQPGRGLDLAHPALPATQDAALGMLGFLERLPAPQASNLGLLLAAVPAGLLLGRAGAGAARRGAMRVHAWLARAVEALLRLAPLAAFGAIAYTIGAYGMPSLLPLLRFIVAVNAASLLFVALVFGAAARLAGMPLLRYLSFIRAELLLVFVTSSSMVGLAPLAARLERLGCPPALTGVVLPFSYSLNLAGTYLYIALALLFLAQAAHVALGWQDMLALLAVALVSSKGAMGVAGSGIATLAATVAVLHLVPVDTVAILLGIDRTMKCRLLTNVIGHGVACVVLAAREGSLDRDALRRALGPDGPAP